MPVYIEIEIKGIQKYIFTFFNIARHFTNILTTFLGLNQWMLMGKKGTLDTDIYKYVLSGAV